MFVLQGNPETWVINFLRIHVFHFAALSGVWIIYSTPKSVRHEVTIYLSSPNAHYNEQALSLIQPSSVLLHSRLLVFDVSKIRKILCLPKYE